MLTPIARSTVSFVAMLAALGACARAPSPVTWDGAPVTAARRVVIQFDNQARTYVDVYLVGDKREWWLGRVAAGALAELRVPDEARESGSSFLRLAVLAGTGMSMQAARDPRATFTIAQPSYTLLTQRWTFSTSQASVPEILGSPMAVVRP